MSPFESYLYRPLCYLGLHSSLSYSFSPLCCVDWIEWFTYSDELKEIGWDAVSRMGCRKSRELLFSGVGFERCIATCSIWLLCYTGTQHLAWYSRCYLQVLSILSYVQEYIVRMKSHDSDTSVMAIVSVHDMGTADQEYENQPFGGLHFL